MDICEQQKYIPNGVEMRIKLTQSSDAFRINAKENLNYKLQLVDATLRVCQVKLVPQLLLRHDEMFAKKPAVYDFVRSDLKTYSLAAGSYTAQLENIYNGKIPTEILLAMVSSEGYSGSYKRDPFVFKHYNVTYLEVSVDGVSVPGPPIVVDFKNDDINDAYYRMQKGVNEAWGINRVEYPKGYSLFRFDLAPYLQTNSIAPSKTGNLRLTLRFADALPEGVTLIVYGKLQDRFLIDQARNVIQG